MAAEPALSILALNCTLKSSSQGLSSTQKMIDLLLAELDEAGSMAGSLRVADFDIKPGVTSDEGAGDDWPMIRSKIVASDILIVGSPVWLGQPSSICKRVLERMDAFLGETDENGHMPSYGKAALVAVTGNEDGAHHVSAEIYQALNDVGFSLAPNAVAYWVGEAMQTTDFKDLEDVPDTVSKAVRMAARTTAHLARLLKATHYPSVN